MSRPVLTFELAQNWFSSAHCIGTDPRSFDDSSEDGHVDRVHLAIAKRICKGCVVRVECLDYALTNDEHGIWGGTTRPERHEMFQKAVKAS